MMSDDKPPRSLDDLDARLKQAMAARAGKDDPDDAGGPRGPMQGFGWALRIGTELVAALIVGVGLGWLIDSWLDTRPGFLLGGFFLGAAAGILNVYRAASGIGLAVGYQKPDREEGQDGRKPRDHNEI